MLVLSRKAGESLVVGDVAVHVLGIKGSRVRIGIEADSDIAVRRSEIGPRSKESGDEKRRKGRE